VPFRQVRLFATGVPRKEEQAEILCGTTTIAHRSSSGNRSV
jgi:hypothetical protein